MFVKVSVKRVSRVVAMVRQRYFSGLLCYFSWNLYAGSGLLDEPSFEPIAMIVNFNSAMYLV